MPTEQPGGPGAEGREPGRRPSPEARAVGQVLAHGRELGQDLVDWIDLKIEAEKLLFLEALNEKANQAANYAMVGGLAAVGACLLLVAAALGLGAWLGHPAWGFLALGLAFLLVGLGLYLVQPLWKDLRRPALVEEARLEPGAPQGQPGPAPPGKAASGS